MKETREVEPILSLDDLELTDVQVQALNLDDARALPEMGATCGCITCCSCCCCLA